MKKRPAGTLLILAALAFVVSAGTVREVPAPTPTVTAPIATVAPVVTAMTAAPAWAALLTVHAGSPVGGGYLTPLVCDSTATTGGLYYWTGSDYAAAVVTT